MFEENISLVQEGPSSAPWIKVAPLVMIHDGGGTTFSYYLLGNLDRPVYGISNPNFHSGKPWEGGIPEMARHYAQFIKSVIPHGNLILGGWSLGGLLSLEVARVLAEDPALLVLGIVMVDSVCPKTVPTSTLPIAQHAIEWSPSTREDTREAILRCFGEASKMIGQWTLPTWGDETAPEKTQQNGHPPLPSQPHAATKLAPPPVILLRAAEPVPVIEAGVSRVDLHRNDPRLGWDQYRKDLITEVVELPGCHHFNIFIGEASLEAVTTQIKKACRTIELRASTCRQ